MPVMNRSNIKKELAPGLNTVFGLEYDRKPQVWKRYFQIDSSKKAYEEDVLLAGLGAGQVKPEGEGVDFDSGGEAWYQRYTHQTVALAFAMTEEMVEDNLYGDIAQKYSRSMATGMLHTEAVTCANVLNNAFDATNYPIGDARAACSLTHPLWGGGTFANTPSTQADLSEASLEDAHIAIANFVDERGIPIAALAEKLVISPSLQFIAQRLMFTELRPGSSENDLNAAKSMGMFPGGFVVDQRITDTNAWFAITDVGDGLKFFNRVPVQRGMLGDFETGNLRYKARQRYSAGITNPRGLYGSSGGS